MKWWVVSICFLFCFLFFLFSINIENLIYGPIHPVFLSVIFWIIWVLSFFYFWSSSTSLAKEVYHETDSEWDNSDTQKEIKNTLPSIFSRIIPLLIFILSVCAQIWFFSLYGGWSIEIIFIQLLYNISLFYYTILLPYGISLSPKFIKYISIFSCYWAVILSALYVISRGSSIHVLFFTVYGIVFNYSIHVRYFNIVCLWMSGVALILFLYTAFLFFQDIFF